MGLETALIGGGAILGSSLIGSDAAGDAADAQTAAANQANETQRYMYNTTREDNAPFRDTGVAANTRLAQLLGLSTPQTESASLQSYLPSNSLTGAKFVDVVNGVPQANQTLYANNEAYRNAWDAALAAHKGTFGTGYTTRSDASVLNQDLLNRLAPAIQQETQQAQAQMNAPQSQNATTSAQQSATPQANFLMRRFTMDDLNSDPVYQSGLKFTLGEANKGVERQAAASGSLLSGATLKALQDRGIDIMNTKAGEAYNRFNNDQTNIYNRLAGVSGAGQQANSLVGGAGMNTANSISQNQIGVGNARAASAIGSANAWSGALSNGINTYQQNQLLSKIGGNSGDWWNSAAGINANGGGF